MWAASAARPLPRFGKSGSGCAEMSHSISGANRRGPSVDAFALHPREAFEHELYVLLRHRVRSSRRRLPTVLVPTPLEGGRRSRSPNTVPMHRCGPHRTTRIGRYLGRPAVRAIACAAPPAAAGCAAAGGLRPSHAARCPPPRRAARAAQHGRGRPPVSAQPGRPRRALGLGSRDAARACLPRAARQRSRPARRLRRARGGPRRARGLERPSSGRSHTSPYRSSMRSSARALCARSTSSRGCGARRSSPRSTTSPLSRAPSSSAGARRSNATTPSRPCTTARSTSACPSTRRRSAW